MTNGWCVGAGQDFEFASVGDQIVEKCQGHCLAHLLMVDLACPPIYFQTFVCVIANAVFDELAVEAPRKEKSGAGCFEGVQLEATLAGGDLSRS